MGKVRLNIPERAKDCFEKWTAEVVLAMPKRRCVYAKY